MAKKEMKCPFSGKLCKNCALFIGRHYYLCFNDRYRGYIKNRKAMVSNLPVGAPNTGSITVPRLKNKEAYDPFNVVL
jgi:hypothetical protein